jgi:hypothetical protein
MVTRSTEYTYRWREKNRARYDAYMKRYNHSATGKASLKRYRDTHQGVLRERSKQYAHSEAGYETQRRYREAHREELRERARTRYADRIRAYRRQRHSEFHSQIVARLGNACERCGKTDVVFHIHHRDGSGTEHRGAERGRNNLKYLRGIFELTSGVLHQRFACLCNSCHQREHRRKTKKTN